ncbi:hypothetical protein [Microcoleus phage My-WqHQDG]|nr:hypothetical protein [Microcoleus phage My-WqHQDG]
MKIDKHYRRDILPTPRKKYHITVTVWVDLFKALAYYYFGSTSIYFVLMVPTNLGIEDTYTFPIAQWFYSTSTWMAPMIVLLLWLLVAALVGVAVLYIIKGMIYLIQQCSKNR